MNNNNMNNGKNNVIGAVIITVLVMSILMLILVIVGSNLGWFGGAKTENNTSSVAQNIDNSSKAYSNDLAENSVNTSNNTIENDTEKSSNKKNDTNENKISSSATNTDKNGSETIKKLTIDDDTIVKILINMDDFYDGQKLSNQEYLKAAYTAINDGYIKLDNKNSREYTTGEINSIIYSIFGVKLSSYENYGTVLKYENGVYKFEYSDRGVEDYHAKNVYADAAAGTRYINYDLYVTDESGESDMGSYAIGISNQDNFVRSKRKMN